MLEGIMNWFSGESGDDSSLEHSLVSSSSSLELEEIIIEELKTAPFIGSLRRRDSVVDLNGLKDHQNIITNVVELPEDHTSYQEQTKERITSKIEGWKDGGELTEEEADRISEMMEAGGMEFGVVDTEEFIDSIRDYLHFKREHGEYSEKEGLVNDAANTVTELLLNREELYNPENVGLLLEKMRELSDAIEEVEAPESLKWAGVKAKVDALYDEVDNANLVSSKNALEMQSLMASWPPSLDNRLLENKSRVNTKILTRSKEMDLFDMPIEDLMLREASKDELAALNKAMTKTHSIKGEMVVLRPEDINSTIREFRECYNKLDRSDKKEVYLQYGKDLEEFVTVLNSLKADSTKGSSDKFKRQISHSSFQDAAAKFKRALEDQNPQLDGMDKLITAVGGIIGDFEASGGTKRVETAYKALIKAIGEAPMTLSPNVLALTKAKEQSTHDKDSTWYRDDLFKTTKGLAEGCASIFEELNEYHKYINELNNFVLSLITVKGVESEEALESRANIIRSLSIEAIEGSVNDITNWQSQRKTETAIANIRAAMGALSGSDVPGALSTTMDALAGFKTAFDPIAGRNFTKGSTTISGQDVATAARDTTYDNPLNPSNGKEAGKGIAIMKGSVDTLMALKTVVLEFTKPPGTKTLEKTINLCEKWNNAILNLSFEKDVKNLTKNIDILSKYPEISIAPSVIEDPKDYTVQELQEKEAGFSLASFKETLMQRLLESIEKHFKAKAGSLERFYALRFTELLKIIKKEIETADYSDEPLKVNYVNGMMGAIEDSSYSALLTPLQERYHSRIDKEIDWREASSGKASKIETEDGFSKKTPITTYKDAKAQGTPQIDYYISEVGALEKKISDSTTSMDVKIFLPNVNTTQFGVFANAVSKVDIEGNKKRYRDTFQNIIESSETAALPTVLKSMKTTAKVADSIDMMSSSFVQASRILTSIVPANDMSEENFQVGAKKWQAAINLVGTAVGTAASITAAFVGPYAPIPLLIGGVVKGITSAINLIIGQRIKASEAREYLDKFIAIFEKASNALQKVRNAVSGHRESLQGWLENILNAMANIEKYEVA